MQIQRKPGETLEVDWAGKTIDLSDSVTGEVTPAYLFVGALSCSGLVYAEACLSYGGRIFHQLPCARP